MPTFRLLWVTFRSSPSSKYCCSMSGPALQDGGHLGKECRTWPCLLRVSTVSVHSLAGPNTAGQMHARFGLRLEVLLHLPSTPRHPNYSNLSLGSGGEPHGPQIKLKSFLPSSSGWQCESRRAR